MFDKLKQLNQARVLAKKMEDMIEKTDLIVENPVVRISGNLKIVKNIEFKIEINEDAKNKIQDGLKLAFNKYINDAEDGKKKLMMESMGGMSGMMDMLKGVK